MSGREAEMGYVGRVATAVHGLYQGLMITLVHYLRFGEVITQQYPENRATLKIPARFRGKIHLQRDPEASAWRCTACGLCVKACPNNSLTVKREKDPETGKFKLAGYYYHFERCVLCGNCVDACKFSALRMGNEFENAVYDRCELTLRLDTPDGVPRPAPEAP